MHILLKGISWGWRAQAGRARGHQEPRKGVNATRLPEGAREVGDAVQLPKGGTSPEARPRVGPIHIFFLSRLTARWDRQALAWYQSCT